MKTICTTIGALLVLLLASGFAGTTNGAVPGPVEDHYFAATLFIMPTWNVVPAPVAVGNLAHYESVYGKRPGPSPDAGYLAAQLFFANGGRTLLALAPQNSSPAAWLAAIEASSALEVDLVAMPGLAAAQLEPGTARAIAQALAGVMDLSGNQFGLIDAPAGATVAGLLDFAAVFQTRHSALYAPALDMWPPGAASPTQMPVSAALAGVISRIDRELGIFKSPAGPNAQLSDVPSIALQLEFDEHQLSSLNQAGINPLRRLSSPDRILVWGTRTTSPSTEWRYIPVSRLQRLLQFSIRRSLIWPGTLPPPAAVDVQLAIKDYLHGWWLRGAFPGSSPAEAYFVNCTGMPELQCSIGFAPTRPAEFVHWQWRFEREPGVFCDGFEAGAIQSCG